MHMATRTKLNSKVPVSERALLARIKRKLAPDGVRLHKSREGSRALWEFGDYYGVSADNHVCNPSGGLEGIARDLGVMKPYEELVDA
jgi:hypothetical protein